MAVKGKSVWPPPVYVATFSDGTVCRMSIWTRQGKPFDFERGRKVCCSAIGGERAFRAHREANPGRWVEGVRRGWTGKPEPYKDFVQTNWHPDQMPRITPAADLVAGHFEHLGETIPDPFFEPEAAPVRKRVSAIERLIASLDKLTADDLARLSAEVDGRLLAAE